MRYRGVRGGEGKPVGGKTLIIGVGNLLLKDEGVGVRVVQELQKKILPPSVEVCDGGVAGIGLLDFFQEASKLLLIDAAAMNLNPGTVRRFTPENVKDLSGGAKFSTHDMGLLEVLELAQALGRCPQDVAIIGIQPGEISWGTNLSPEVEAAIPQIMEMVLREISSNFIATEVTEATENNKMNKECETSTP